MLQRNNVLLNSHAIKQYQAINIYKLSILSTSIVIIGILSFWFLIRFIAALLCRPLSAEIAVEILFIIIEKGVGCKFDGNLHFEIDRLTIQ